MDAQKNVLEYKCPCCDAGLVFGNETQRLKCEYCDNTFELDAVRAYNESQAVAADEFRWEISEESKWDDLEQEHIRMFQCPSCGGEIITDEHTAATFCPYCDNPTVMPSRLSGVLRPAGVIPFQTDKLDAKQAFLKLCKGKMLLPREFTREHRLEKITGMYVPFWLYDCSAEFNGSYKATRIRHWSDSRYDYTKTEYFLLNRGAKASFSGIPMDASSKMEDSFMESIEPFDYSLLKDFDMAYLTGYLADKYDVTSESGEERIRQRVDQSVNDQLQNSFLGYSTVIPTSRQLQLDQGKAKYVLLPVWVLNTRYKEKIYTFAMNGQSGKITGTFPICPKRAVLWFSGIFTAVTAISAIIQWIAR